MFVREMCVTYKRTGVHSVPNRLVTCSRDAAAIVRELIPDGPQEHFIALALDAKNYVVAFQRIGIGCLTSMQVDQSAVLRFVLLAGAPRLLVAHNHPSGNPSPSESDKVITGRLIQACDLLAIAFMDHVIVGENEAYFSFRDSGELHPF